jgi:hypothetical protein
LIPKVLSGAPLPFKIVFEIVLDVLPADLGFFAACEMGIAVALKSDVSKSVAIIPMYLRLRFMEPPGPLTLGN